MESSRQGGDSFESISGKRPAHAAALSAREIEGVLSRLMAEYVAIRRNPSHELWVPLFRDLATSRLREARLMARVYPDGVKRFAIPIVADPMRPILEWHYARYLSGELAAQGDREAEGELLRLAHLRHGRMSESALCTLAYVDAGGVHRGLYSERAREGQLGAIRVLGSWGDPATIDLMKGLIAANPAPEAPQSSIRLAAQDTLRKVETLLSPDADARIAALIETPSPENDAWTPWALHVAKIRKIPDLAEILRKRLDAAYRDARRLEERMAVRGGFLPSFLDENMVTGYDYVTDNYFDDILVLQSEIGGPLTDLEKARLRHFGYACDPRERLAELLAEEAAAPK